MPVTAWLSATRPKTLAAGAAPVAVGVACASTVVPIHWPAAVACLMGAILIQIGCNFANDAFDALKGADTPERLGPQRAVASGLISARAMLLATAVVLVLALLIGLFLWSIAGWPIFLVGVVSLVCAVAYTGGPAPLAYVGLGDLFVFLFFGLVAVLGSAHVQLAAEQLRLATVLPNAVLSLPGTTWLGLPIAWWCAATGIGLQATAIICVNNLRDIATDQRAGKRTVGVRLGDQASRWYYGLLQLLAALAYGAGLVVLPEARHLPWICAAAIAFIGGQLLTRAVRQAQGAALNRLLALTALLELATAVVLSLLLALR